MPEPLALRSTDERNFVSLFLKVEEGAELVVRLVTEGEWRIKGGELQRVPGSEGYSVWRLKQGKLHAKPCSTAVEVVKECLA